jgi:hypothetical protein
MTISKKWFCISALIVAGLLSVLCSFLGLFALGWGGFGRGKGSVAMLGFVLPLLIAFPLFALSLGVTRFASLGLWCAAPYHWFWLIEVSSSPPSQGPLEFLKLLARCFVEPQVLLLLFVAVLVQFGIQAIPTFSFDNYLYEKLRGGRDSSA